MGQSPDSRFYNESGDGLPFFQGKADFGALYPTPRKWCSEPKKVAETGDILLSVRAPVGPTNLAKEKCCIGRGLAAIRASEPISQKYLLHYFRHIQPWLSGQGTGSTFSAISGPFLRGIQVLIAPSNEQLRIVNKLDAVLARADACREHLARVPDILKRFRQDVLTAAISGTLTEEWRVERDRSSSSWEQTTVGALIERIEAGLNVKCEERPPRENERGLVKISAVTWGSYNDNESKTLLAGKDVPELARIRLGDFLITRANTLELVGACVIVHKVTRPVFLSDKVLRLVMPDAMKPWLLYILQSRHGRKQIESLASGNQLSMRNLSQANLKSIIVPLPARDERDEILRRVDTLLAFANRIETRYQAVRTQIDNIIPTTLAKAFRGELVPQDPNDEPAASLLDRIRGARKSVASTDLDTQKRGKTRIKKTILTEVQMLTRKEIDAMHLTTILKERGSLTAEKLWSASQLEIDDFYDQLKDEEARGLLMEKRDASSGGQRLLEAVG
jgi:type I restriction enzyme S subunit